MPPSKCVAITLKGNPCTNRAKDGSDKCGIHLRSSAHSLSGEPKACIICLNNISKKNCIETECNHHFHIKCIAKWSGSNNNPKCPMCRATLVYHDDENKIMDVFEHTNNRLRRVLKGKNKKIQKLKDEIFMDNYVPDGLTRLTLFLPSVYEDDLPMIRKVLSDHIINKDVVRTSQGNLMI